MESNWLVSVIIPVYNVRPFLEEALDSVLNQSYANLEILVIDDGSTDGSGETCDAYAKRDGRVRVIHQENRGLSAARNAGLERMTGEMVAFLDPDDAYDEHAIEAMASAMVREDADMVLCRYTNHATTGRLAGRRSKRPNPLIAPGVYDRASALQALADGTINVSVWNKLCKRGVWRDIRFPEGHVYEDISTCMSIFDRCGRVCVIGQVLYNYRTRAGSITHTYRDPAIIDDWIAAYSHYISLVEANTPDLFSPKQLTRLRCIQFNGMMIRYIHYSGAVKGDAYADDLLRRINERGRNTDVLRFGFRTQAAYCMLRVCPRLLQLVYPVYRAVRMCIYRIIGR